MTRRGSFRCRHFRRDCRTLPEAAGGWSEHICRSALQMILTCVGARCPWLTDIDGCRRGRAAGDQAGPLTPGIRLPGQLTLASFADESRQGPGPLTAGDTDVCAHRALAEDDFAPLSAELSPSTPAADRVVQRR